jgi:hypothetical protein
MNNGIHEDISSHNNQEFSSFSLENRWLADKVQLIIHDITNLDKEYRSVLEKMIFSQFIWWLLIDISKDDPNIVLWILMKFTEKEKIEAYIKDVLTENIDFWLISCIKLKSKDTKFDEIISDLHVDLIRLIEEIRNCEAPAK